MTSHNLSMPHCIIRSGIFRPVKPHELIAALMAREGLGPLPLAKKMGRPKLQPQIHRFVNGEVASPARTTAEPLAAYFKIPTEAIYTEKAATAVAVERDISAVLPKAPRRKRETSAKTSTPSDEAMKIARRYDRLTEAGKQRYRLLMLVAQDGIDPTEAEASLASMGVEADLTELHGVTLPSGVDMPPPQPPATPPGSEFKYKMENRPAQSRGLLNSSLFKREQKSKKAGG